MKHQCWKIFVYGMFLLSGGSLPAQMELPPKFGDLLTRAGIDFAYPLEARYKTAPRFENPFQVADFAIRSRKEKLEIRYVIRPLPENDPLNTAPHVAATRLVLHLATNDQEAYIAAHEIDPVVLKEEFNADWGKIFFFKPKLGFSSRSQCKMLALFREGKGMAYVFFLFDDPPETLDARTLALRFN